jgi:hypothetical protein
MYEFPIAADLADEMYATDLEMHGAASEPRNASR